MKVSLVAPRIPPAAMNFHFAMPLGGWSFSHIPYQLATVAALTPPHIAVEIQDENAGPVDLDVDADVVGLTGIYCQRARLLELARAFRERGKVVAIGGPIAQDLPEECSSVADAIFQGDAELTWPRFLHDLERGTPERIYAQPPTLDLSASPVPRFDLLRRGAYSSACIQATRGCPYACDYCDVPVRHGSRSRSKPIETVLEEVRRLSALGHDSIFFVDDHFAGNRRYAKELLAALAALVPTLALPPYFYTQVTLNVARDEELLELFHAANFRRFFIGIETPETGKLRALSKHHNVELEMRAAIEKIQQRGITVWAGIILGLDGDGPETFERQRRFIQETAITPTLIGLLQAMPGTPLHERLAAAGRIRAVPDVVGSGAFGSLEAAGVSNVVLEGALDDAALLRGFAALVRSVYEPEAYAERILASARRSRVAAPSLATVWKCLTRENALTIARTVKHYALHRDPSMRRLFRRVLGALATRQVEGLGELLYHLVVYEHLRTFYGAAAERALAAAGSLEERVPA